MSNSFEQWLDAKGVAPRDFGRMETILKYANKYAAEREQTTNAAMIVRMDQLSATNATLLKELAGVKDMHKKQFQSLRIVCARMVKKNQHEAAVSTIDLMELEEILAAIDGADQ